MKILVVCGAGYVSGVEVVTLSLIQGLRKRGHEVRCVTTTWGDGDFAGRLESNHVPYKRLPLGFISKTLTWSAVIMTLDQMWKLPRLWLGYLRYSRDFKPDIVLHSNFHHIFLLWLLLNRGRHFYHVHNAYPPTRFYQLLFRFLSLRLWHFAGVSRFVANSLVTLGIQKSKVSFVHNGVEAPKSNRSTVGELKAHTPGNVNGPRSQVVRIGIVGQIGEWKGHDDFFEALCLLKSQGIDFTGLVFGRGDSGYIETLKGKLSQCGLSDKIRWAGYFKNTEEIFSNLDICVVPSRVQEAYGMVVVEAALFGIPVIATRRGGMPEIICDGVTGFLVEVDAPKQIAEKLTLLIQDCTLRREMGSAACKHAQGNFTQAKMAEKMEEIFRKS